MPNGPCPEAPTVKLLLVGLVGDDEAVSLEQHLLDCDRCCQTARTLELGQQLDDTLADALRPDARLDEIASEEPVRLAMARLATLRPAATDSQAGETFASASESTDDAWGLQTLLDPPQAEGELGWFAGYRVLRVLGAGGMGIVFDALDLRLQRHVALKLMKPQLAAQGEQRQRFLREARAAAAIEHPHIVALYQVGEHREIPFLAMQLLKGQSMDERIREGARLPLAECLRIGRETAEALAAAHQRGLIHRDIKPANIWLEAPGGWVKLVDFGLAHVLEDEVHLTQTGAVVGTPAYMSPEQARGDAIGARSDLFSLGVVLYRLTTGQTPFTGRGTLALLTALATATPQRVSELNPDLPPEFADVIMRLLAKDPAERFESAEAVAEAIRAIETSRVGIAHQPLAGAERSDAPVRRRPRWPWAVAAAAAAALFAGIVVIIRDKEGREVARMSVPEGGSATMQPALPDEKTPTPSRSVSEAASPTAGQPPPASPIGARSPSAVYRLPTLDDERAVAEWVADRGGATDAGTEFLNLPIREIRFVGNRSITDDALARLLDCPRLAWLDLSGTAISDAGMVNLAGIGSLRRLNLNGIKVSEAGLAHLADLERLEWLDLGRTRVGDAGLATLAKAFPWLRALDLEQTWINDAGLPALAELDQLDQLSLSGANITDGGLAHLEALTGLMRLSLQGTKVSDAGIATLHRALADCWIAGADGRLHAPPVREDDPDRKLAALLLEHGVLVPLTTDGIGEILCHAAVDLPQGPFRLLRMPGLPNPHPRPFDDAELDLLPEARCLRIADLSHTGITDRGLERLRGLPKLEQLTLVDCPRLTGNALSVLGTLPRLRRLNLGRQCCTHIGLRRISALANLELLLIEGEVVDDLALERLAGLSKLVGLELRNTAVSGAGLTRLAALRELSFLRLAGQNVQDDHLARLAALSGLEHLALEAAPISSAGLEGLTALPRLLRLDLAIHLDDDGCQSIARLSSLESLDVGDATRVTDAGLAHLARLPDLRHLWLGNAPRITDVGLAHLQGIKSLKGLGIDPGDGRGISQSAVAAFRATGRAFDFRGRPSED
jgi:eukaryotic-like serine/threonine-protein kinase